MCFEITELHLVIGSGKRFKKVVKSLSLLWLLVETSVWEDEMTAAACQSLEFSADLSSLVVCSVVPHRAGWLEQAAWNLDSLGSRLGLGGLRAFKLRDTMVLARQAHYYRIREGLGRFSR